MRDDGVESRAGRLLHNQGHSVAAVVSGVIAVISYRARDAVVGVSDQSDIMKGRRAAVVECRVESET